MSDELMPCPMCGGAAKHVRHFAGLKSTTGYDQWHGVSCLACNACVGASDRRFRIVAEATAAWNRRATPTPPVEPVKEADVSDEVLTDDQIEDIWAAVSPFDGEVDMIEYARKIESAVVLALRGGHAMSLTLSESEIVALTGYQYPTRQLEVLRARGFYRAVMGRNGVVLTRAHYEAVESGQDAAPVKIKGINLSHLKLA